MATLTLCGKDLLLPWTTQAGLPDCGLPNFLHSAPDTQQVFLLGISCLSSDVSCVLFFLIFVSLYLLVHYSILESSRLQLTHLNTLTFYSVCYITGRRERASKSLCEGGGRKHPKVTSSES